MPRVSTSRELRKIWKISNVPQKSHLQPFKESTVDRGGSKLDTKGCAKTGHPSCLESPATRPDAPKGSETGKMMAQEGEDEENCVICSLTRTYNSAFTSHLPHPQIFIRKNVRRRPVCVRESRKSYGNFFAAPEILSRLQEKKFIDDAEGHKLKGFCKKKGTISSAGRQGKNGRRKEGGRRPRQSNVSN